MPDLDRQLRETGARLFDEIRIPDLDLVRTRARRIRQRRRGLAAGASTLAVLLVVGLGLTSLDRLTGGPEPVPAASDPTGTLWQGGGLDPARAGRAGAGPAGRPRRHPVRRLEARVRVDRRVHPGLPGRARGDHRRRPLVVGLAHARRRRHRRPAAAADHGRRGVAIAAGSDVFYATYPRSDWVHVVAGPTAELDAVPAGGRLWQAGTDCGSPLNGLVARRPAVPVAGGPDRR